MLEKPDLPNPLIVSRLQAEYGLEVRAVTFLPLGYDFHTAVYRVDTPDGKAYFLKLRKGPFDLITVAVPQFLSKLGIQAIISPLPSLNGQLTGKLENYTLILYPFILGKDGYQMKLSDQHWIKLGWTLKMVHSVQVPPALAALIPHETYDPQWRECVKRFLSQVDQVIYNEPVAEKLSAFLKRERQKISQMVSRAEELAEQLRPQAGDIVLCHSDAHPGNYLIAENSGLYLVDWDNPIFALKERDLMFFGSGMSGDRPGGWEESLFYQGYGDVHVNQKALAYYRYERIIQDIAEFCKQILLTSASCEDRLQSYEYLVSSFSPGNVVEAAVQTDQESGI